MRSLVVYTETVYTMAVLDGVKGLDWGSAQCRPYCPAWSRPGKSRERSSGPTRSSLQKTWAARSAGSFSVHPRLDGIWWECSRFEMNQCGLSRLTQIGRASC